MCMNERLAYVCVCSPCVCNACRGQKMALDPLELELQIATIWVLGIQPSSSERAVLPLNHFSSPEIS